MGCTGCNHRGFWMGIERNGLLFCTVSCADRYEKLAQGCGKEISTGFHCGESIEDERYYCPACNKLLKRKSAGED